MQPTTSPGARKLWQRIPLAVAVIVAALLVLGGLRAALAAGSPRFHATAYEPPAPAAEFSLTDHTGRQLSLSTLRGTPLLLFFGYTRCPDVCPLTLNALGDALQAAEASPGDARVLLVTVDPVNDTPEALAAYVQRFGTDVVGLTGSSEQIRSVMADYGIHAAQAHGNSAMLGHTSAVFGIDRNGMIRVLLRPDASREALRDDVRTLLEL